MFKRVCSNGHLLQGKLDIELNSPYKVVGTLKQLEKDYFELQETGISKRNFPLHLARNPIWWSIWDEIRTLIDKN